MLPVIGEGYDGRPALGGGGGSGGGGGDNGGNDDGGGQGGVAVSGGQRLGSAGDVGAVSRDQAVDFLERVNLEIERQERQSGNPDVELLQRREQLIDLINRVDRGRQRPQRSVVDNSIADPRVRERMGSQGYETFLNQLRTEVFPESNRSRTTLRRLGRELLKRERHGEAQDVAIAQNMHERRKEHEGRLRQIGQHVQAEAKRKRMQEAKDDSDTKRLMGEPSLRDLGNKAKRRSNAKSAKEMRDIRNGRMYGTYEGEEESEEDLDDMLASDLTKLKHEMKKAPKRKSAPNRKSIEKAMD